jgi:hypothetical protein
VRASIVAINKRKKLAFPDTPFGGSNGWQLSLVA